MSAGLQMKGICKYVVKWGRWRMEETVRAQFILKRKFEEENIWIEDFVLVKGFGNNETVSYYIIMLLKLFIRLVIIMK